MQVNFVKWATWITIAVSIAVGIYGLIINPGASPDSLDYGLFLDGVWFTFLAVFLYWKYKQFNQTPLSHGLVMFLILAHIAGALWFYGQTFIVEYDIIMHFIGGIVLAFFFYNYAGRDVKGFRLAVVTVLMVLGLSAVHEILEFIGYATLGTGTGVFQFGVGDFGEYNDAMWDLIMNFFGAVIGTFLCKKGLGFRR